MSIPGAEILARVGNEVILAREVSWGIDELRERNKDRAPASVLEQSIRDLLKKRVNERVDEKLLFLDAQRKIPKDRFNKYLEFAGKTFDTHQVPEMMKQMNLGSRGELEQALRQAGISLEIYKRGFIEKGLAHEWLRSEAKVDEDVPYQQILDYYRTNEAEFVERPPSARWEELMVRKSQFRSRDAAYAALAEMGNQVLDGAPLAEVAKARSHGPTASNGGFWDWTGKGHLNSPVLNEAVFSLPVGRLSPILEDDQGFHIVRVIERRDVEMKPFAEAQVGIRKKILADRNADAKAAFLAKLRSQTAVQTVFDNDPSATAARVNSIFH